MTEVRRRTHMNPEHLTKLLAAGREEDPQRSAACPDEHQVAGYVDGTLDAVACEQLERHAAECGHCLALVGMLSRERDASPQGSGAQASLAPGPATTAVAAGQSRPTWLAPQWAIAATLLLAVPLLFQLGRRPDSGAEGQAEVAVPPTRTVTLAGTDLQVLSPAPGTAVDPRQMSFQWTAVNGTPYYEVRIVTDAGDIVVQQRVSGTSWQPPAPLDLQPGAEYFVLVDAFPEGDKAVSSHHVPFRISD